VTGGDGGPGGDIINLNGRSGSAPGAGASGAGAVGDGAIGGKAVAVENMFGRPSGPTI
jgi:hypothetical protein